MKRLIFEIISHGVSDPQHFLGCGVIGTPFTHCATGSGSSEHDAGCDAQEILLQSTKGDGITITDLMVLEGRVCNLSVEENAHDACQAEYDRHLHVNDFEKWHEECDAAHYVSIRWRVE